MSVILLGLLKSLVFRGRLSYSSWIVRTRGALTLLCIRGMHQSITSLRCVAPMSIDSRLEVSLNRFMDQPMALHIGLSNADITAVAYRSLMH